MTETDLWNGARGTTSAEIFDQLRMEIHIKSTLVSLGKLSTTSSTIKENLKCKFAVYVSC